MLRLLAAASALALVPPPSSAAAPVPADAKGTTAAQLQQLKDAFAKRGATLIDARTLSGDRTKAPVFILPPGGHRCGPEGAAEPAVPVRPVAEPPADTDVGVAELKGLTHLTRLYLSCREVTDAGVAHLAGLAGLTELDLRGT